MRLSTATFLATFAASASAYSANQRSFAVNHFYGNGPLVIGRMDPIVDPGAASGHVHAVQGGNQFALTMTDSQALESTCTSSLVKNDKSNYWTPSLYFHAANGSFISVPMFYMNVYYFFEATTDKIQAFQPGHRMVIGNPTLRSPPATGGKSILDNSDGTPQPVQWTCPRTSTAQPLYPTDSDGLHGVGIQDPGNQGAGVGFPDQDCDGYASPMRADIHFPSCYNPAAGLDNYKENMAWPTKGNCPEGWIHTPHLFYEVYWNTPLFSDEWTPGQGKQPWVLSNGDPTGYGLHADFISGWDVETLQQVIDNCDAGDAGMDKCPGLIGGLNDPSTDCTIQCPINEVVLGEMEQLPGNNPLGQWGVGSSAGSGTAPTTTVVPPAGTTPATSVVGSTAVGGSGTTPATSVAVSTSVGDTATTPAISAVPTPVESSLAAGQDTASGGDIIMTSFQTTYFWTTVTVTNPAPGPSSPTSSPATSSSITAGWSYLGCYSDQLGSGHRVMTGIEFANIGNHAVTNTKCVAYCDAKGFSMAGTEYGGQCFCANIMVGSSILDTSKCNMACEGDGTQTCGGSLALSIYSKPSPKSKRSHVRHLQQHVRGVSN